jgi:RNA polymerase sigma factor for flagellar operon FliA
MCYRRGVDARERARLVEDNLEVARKAARMYYKRVAEHVEFNELVSLGNIGLAEAAAKFDPKAGASFATFAWYRVQGAIVDGCRKNTALPRRVWAKLVALRAASEYLEHQADRQRGAVASGAPAATGKDALAQVKDAISAIGTMYLTSLEAAQEDGFDTAEPVVDQAERIDDDRNKRRMRKAIDKLPDKERALLTKHYWEGKNLLEAGAELGISKSWASRLHAQAVDRLRTLVDDGG